MRLPADAIAGTKTVFTLAHADDPDPNAPTTLGKIEVLATGQQCAIAGGHHGSGRRMTWFVEADLPEIVKRHPAPMLDRAPSLTSRDEVMALIAGTLDSLAEQGLRYTAAAAAENGANGPTPALAGLAAPSVTDMVELLDQTPTRHRWIVATIPISCLPPQRRGPA